MGNFVVYKSGAGSGKTFTLVKEYLRLALHDDTRLTSNYRRILAITFTNKAAAEMKTRVINTLNQMANQDEFPGMGDVLCKEIKVSRAELKRRSSIVLSDMLHHYSDLSIGTIDSFTHKIVKTFAHDLHLPVNFNVELDTETFYNKVIATIFSKIGEDTYISKLLREYALNMATDNASWDPEKQIQDFTKLLLKENAGPYVERLRSMSVDELETIRLQILDFTKHYRNVLITLSKKALKLIEQNGLTDEDFHYKKNGPQSFFRRCIALNVNLSETKSKRITDAITEGKWAGKDGDTKTIERISPDLNAIANELIDFITGHYTYYSLCTTLDRQMYPLMLLKKIEEISQEQKQEERLVFISEFNQKISDIINNEPTPFIYERLGERYKHYLLDEFQDTSTMQWHNILPLIDNALAAGWYNLVVGDGKQSIYRWRNANVQQFAKLPEIEQENFSPLTQERAEALRRNYEARLLGQNFRSSKRVVEFNNDFFQFCSESLLDETTQAIYRQHAQIPKNQTEEGYVSITLGKVNADLVDENVCAQIKSRILDAKESGFAFRDIAILCRKNNHGNLIADYLVKQKIPVVSSDSLLLKNNLEVNTILNYLRYLVDRNDQIAAASVIEYLHHSSVLNEEATHEAFREIAKGKSLFKVLEEHQIVIPEETISLNNLFDHCLQIITVLKLTESAYPYIRFFLDEVNEFLVLKNSNLTSFFDWWENKSKKASMVIPETTDAVQIMTIHTSKGLEFPVTIVPYCNWQFYRADNSWVNIEDPKLKLPVSVVNLSKKAADSGFEKELQKEEQEQKLDNLNLLYVAFTRAIDRLHIICTSSENQKTHNVFEWVESYAKKHMSSSDGVNFESGKAITKTTEHSLKSLVPYYLEPLSFSGPNKNIHIKASYKLNNQEAEQAKEQGLLLHFLLSKLKTKPDLDETINEALLQGLISSEQKPNLFKTLQQLISHPELSLYFEPGIHTKLEAELITAEGELLRPDRVVFTPEATVIIDYKTGKENTSRYAQQLYKYENALRTMGHQNIKKILVYVDLMKVISLN
ncbi:MAG: UvrD-helicase domain-containing protein [Bacteroidia bacterium]|nr:UvrD-helicase domain-containing protein [Bacteroidia bacterium]